MIYYFSATGNSRHTAKRLGEALTEQVVSVLDVQYPVKVGSGERMILVYPNYCCGTPIMIRNFLKEGTFELADDAELIMVVTYGNNTGANDRIAPKYFKGNTGRVFDAMYSVKMPDNWTPHFDLSDPVQVAEWVREGDVQIDGVIEKILAGSKGDFIENKLDERAEGIHEGFYHELSKTSHLAVEDHCIGCGLCAEQCPVKAIEMRDGKPYWVPDNCAMCLGCLHRCPVFAIQYDNQTKNHGQYLHPDEK